MADEGVSLEVNVAGKRFRDASKGLLHLADRMGVAFADLSPAVQREMRDVLDTVVEALRQRHSTKWSPGQRLPRGPRRGRLASRSGSGLSGLRTEVTGSGVEVSGRLIVPFPLSVHETGATVRKKAKLLAVPLPAALDSRGVPKRPGPRDWPRTFVAKSRKGNVLVFQKRGSRIVPLYVLKEEVKIPRRLGARATLTEVSPLLIDRVLEAALKSVREKVVA